MRRIVNGWEQLSRTEDSENIDSAIKAGPASQNLENQRSSDSKSVFPDGSAA